MWKKGEKRKASVRNSCGNSIEGDVYEATCVPTCVMVRHKKSGGPTVTNTHENVAWIFHWELKQQKRNPKRKEVKGESSFNSSHLRSLVLR